MTNTGHTKYNFHFPLARYLNDYARVGLKRIFARKAMNIIHRFICNSSQTFLGEFFEFDALFYS